MPDVICSEDRTRMIRDVPFGIALYEFDSQDDSRYIYRHVGLTNDEGSAINWLDGKEVEIIHLH